MNFSHVLQTSSDAAFCAHAWGLLPLCVSVRAVGQFKQLVELSNTDPRFNEKLKQFLIPNKAREHVALAVENDKRLRMWYPEPNNIEGGLLYRSVRARVDLEHPDGQHATFTPLLARSCTTVLLHMLLCMHEHSSSCWSSASGNADSALLTVVWSRRFGGMSGRPLCHHWHDRQGVLSTQPCAILVLHKVVPYSMTDFETRQDCAHPLCLAAPLRLTQSDRSCTQPIEQE